MPSLINATTTNGLVTSADNSGSLQLQTNNGTTAVTIDTSQKVLVGTTTASSAGSIQMVLSNSVGAGIQFNNSTGVNGGAINSVGGNGLVFYGYSGAMGSESYSERMRIDSSGNLLFNSGYGSVATAYGCRAWVNFNGTTSPGTIRASGNVTSVTKNGTGDYTVNFTNSMPDANYAVAGTCVGSTSNAFSMVCGAGGSVLNTGSVRFGIIASSTGTQQDYTFISISIFR